MRRHRIRTRPVKYSTRNEMVVTTIIVGGLAIWAAFAMGGAAGFGALCAVILITALQWAQWSGATAPAGRRQRERRRAYEQRAARVTRESS
jgi:hypothetical protein